MSKWYSVYVTVRKTVAVEVEDDEGEDEAMDAVASEILGSGDVECMIDTLLTEEPTSHIYDDVLPL